MSQKFGSLIGRIGRGYKEEAGRVKDEAKSELGTLVWISQVRALANASNLELTEVMFDVHVPIEYRVIYAVAFKEHNMDFMEPKEDEHTQKANYHWNQMLKYWMKAFDVLIDLERSLDHITDMTERAEIASFRKTLTFGAEGFIIHAMTLVDNKAHSKIEHVGNTIVVANSPMLNNRMQFQGEDDPLVARVKEEAFSSAETV